MHEGQDVAGHQSTAEAIWRIEAFNRSIIQASSDCIMVIDTEGNIVFMSEAGERALDCRADEVIGRPWLALWPEEARQSLDEAIRSAIETGQSRCTALRRHSGGSATWWDSVVTRISPSDGIANRLLVVARDITGRMEAQERLRESEERYRHTVRVTSQVTWTADPLGALMEIGTRWTDFTGMPLEAALGNGWLAALHPDDQARVAHDRAASLATGEPLDTEFRVRCQEGDYQWVRCRAQARRDGNGAIVKWYGAVENIDAAKRAGEARLQAEERFRLAAQATNDAIWDWDLRSRRVKWSGTLRALFGHDEKVEMTGRWWIEHIHPADLKSVQRGLETVLGSAISHWSDEYRFRRPDGSYAEVFDRGHVIRDANGVGIRMVGAMQDLTERKAAERKIRQMQNELIHVSRLSAMGAMASMLAHELNQPLTAIASYVKGGQRLLESRGATALPALEVALEAAAAQVLRAGEIVRSLRAMVSTGDVERKVENVARLVEEARSLALTGTADIGVICTTELDPRADFVLCDQIQIQQVLLNLIRNAFEALGDHPLKAVAISSRQRSRRVVELRVEDSGPGVAPEMMERLFSPFVTSKDGGMGVGLSICRTIVEAHEGRLWLERSDLGGAAFCFTLAKGSPPARPDGERR